MNKHKLSHSGFFIYVPQSPNKQKTGRWTGRPPPYGIFTRQHYCHGKETALVGPWKMYLNGNMAFFATFVKVYIRGYCSKKSMSQNLQLHSYVAMEAKHVKCSNCSPWNNFLRSNFVASEYALVGWLAEQDIVKTMHVVSTKTTVCEKCTR